MSKTKKTSKTNLIMLNLSADISTGGVLMDLPRETIFSLETVDDDDLVIQKEMEEAGRQLGITMYRGFVYKKSLEAKR